MAGRAEGYTPPVDRGRYHRAAGVLCICHPSVAFVGNQVVVIYDYGYGTAAGIGTKLRVLPIDWLYGS